MISSPSAPPLPPAPGPPPNPPTYGSSFQQNAGARINAANQGNAGFGGTILGSSNAQNTGSPGAIPGAIAGLSAPQAAMSNQKTLLGQ